MVAGERQILTRWTSLSIQHMFISDFLCPSFGGIVLHHSEKYLAIAGFGAVLAAAGLVLFMKTKKEEKHGCCH